jgi:hypothetical protein
MTRKNLELILTALIRMEHKTTGSMTPEEYWATVALARELKSPQFITEYFENKALTEETI